MVTLFCFGYYKTTESCKGNHDLLFEKFHPSLFPLAGMGVSPFIGVKSAAPAIPGLTHRLVAGIMSPCALAH